MVSLLATLNQCKSKISSCPALIQPQVRRQCCRQLTITRNNSTLQPVSYRQFRRQHHLSGDGTLQRRFAAVNFNAQVLQAANLLETARNNNNQISPMTVKDVFPNLDQETAYEIAAAGCGLRMEQGATPIGRKIGFTNSNIWEEYGVAVPNFGYMYDITALTNRQDQVVDLSMFNNLQPKIEPEIVLHLKDKPVVGMNDQELLTCISWVAHAFEIVVSIFPDWKFTAADTTAAGALHGCLVMGPKWHLDHNEPPQALITQLQDFEIELCQNGSIVDTGKGSNVLGGPVSALRHLVNLLSGQTRHPELNANETISTGTLTKALLIKDKDRWQTKLNGIDLPGLDVRFKLK